MSLYKKLCIMLNLQGSGESFLMNLDIFLFCEMRWGRKIIPLLSELTHDVSTFSPVGCLSLIRLLPQLLILLFEDCKT